MTNKPNKIPTPVAGQRDRLPPVRVKLWETDGRLAKVRAPDRDKQILRQRLNKALGTMSFDFVNASLFDLQGVARTPFGRISENKLNAALAMIEAAAPKDEIQGALAVQMACTHTVAMTLLAKMETHFGSERQITAFGSTAARLLRAFATQVEAHRRSRNGGQQFVRVEHVHVNDGGQAVIGNVKQPDRTV